jgi:DNA modification methylase
MRSIHIVGDFRYRTMGADDNSVFDIHKADARELKATLADLFNSTDSLIDAVITSPPYADMENYGEQDEQVGQQPYENFLDDLQSIFRQCYDVTAEHATLWIITDTFRRNGRLVRPPFDLAEDLENLQNRQFCPKDDCNGRLERDRGTGLLYCDICDTKVNPLSESWRLGDHIIWNKQRTRPWQRKGQLRNIHEHISMYTKSDEFKYNQDAVRIEDIEEFGRWWVDYPERYHPKGKLPDNVWEFPIPKQGQWGPKLNYHPSPFPEELVERIIKLATDPGDVILDPFAGVGSTLAVANRLDRKAIGLEINEKYIDYYHNHVLPKVGRKKTEQQKLIGEEEGHTLEYVIWTLRIHKYAFRLQRELIINDNFEIGRSDFTAVHVLANPEDFSADSSPSATLTYIGDDQLTELAEEFDKAKESLISDNRGSGDYYEVDFDIKQCNVRNWFDDIGPQLLAEQPELYVYTNGAHYWNHSEITLEEWEELVEKNQWKRYQSQSWCPLVSTLPIQIDNPLDSLEEGFDENQSILTNFTNYSQSN